jgi:hypothetical protein
MTNKPMTMASRGVTVRDFLIFQLKLFLDGIKDFAAMWLSLFAIIVDFIAGRGKRPRLFYSVVRASERWDRWINLHSVIEEMDESDTDDGLFGASRAGDDTFVGKIEQLVRGGDDPRARTSPEDVGESDRRPSSGG